MEAAENGRNLPVREEISSLPGRRSARGTENVAFVVAAGNGACVLPGSIHDLSSGLRIGADGDVGPASPRTRERSVAEIVPAANGEYDLVLHAGEGHLGTIRLDHGHIVPLHNRDCFFVGGGAFVFRISTRRDRDDLEAERVDSFLDEPTTASSLARVTHSLRDLGEAVFARSQPLVPLLLSGPPGTHLTHYARVFRDRCGRTGAFETIDRTIAPDAAIDRLQRLSTNPEQRDAIPPATVFVRDVDLLPGEMLTAIQEVARRLSRTRPGQVGDALIVGVSYALRADLAVPAWVKAFPFRANVPGLNRRREDIPGLCARALAETSLGIDLDALRELVLRNWVSNALELQAVLDSAVGLAKEDGVAMIGTRHLLPEGAVRLEGGGSLADSLQSAFGDLARTCGFSDRENQIMGKLLFEGLARKEVAAELCLAPETVKSHVHGACKKAGIKSEREIWRAIVSRR